MAIMQRKSRGVGKREIKKKSLPEVIQCRCARGELCKAAISQKGGGRKGGPLVPVTQRGVSFQEKDRMGDVGSPEWGLAARGSDGRL